MVIESFEPTAVFRKEPDGSYVVFCPEVDGVFSEGKNLDEARSRKNSGRLAGPAQPSYHG